MSRWLSRTVPASARRAGRAVVMVSCACACAVMTIPAFPAVTAASVAPCACKNTRCDDFSAGDRRGTGMRGIRKRIVMITVCDSSGGAVTRRTVGRPPREASRNRARHAPGPFGIIVFPGVHGGPRAAGQQPGGWSLMHGLSRAVSLRLVVMAAPSSLPLKVAAKFRRAASVWLW